MEARQFQPSDRVRCVDARGDAPGNGVRYGETYTVTEVRTDCPDLYLEGITYSWRANRFDLVEAASCNNTVPEEDPEPKRLCRHSRATVLVSLPKPAAMHTPRAPAVSDDTPAERRHRWDCMVTTEAAAEQHARQVEDVKAMAVRMAQWRSRGAYCGNEVVGLQAWASGGSICAGHVCTRCWP